MRHVMVVGLVGLLLAGCKKKPPEIAEGDEVGVASVSAELQVVSITPQTVGPGVTTPGRLFGAGFQRDTTVHFGQTAAEGVVYIDENTLTVQIPALEPGVHDVIVRNPTGVESVLRAGLRVGTLVVQELEPPCPSTTVYFALDQAGLTSEARAAVDAQLPCYVRETVRLLVEGHADERGTTDYNLALGQRRANSVKAHLVNGGVSTSRVETVSWGEERPVDPGHNEAAWARNRRAEIRVQR